MAKTKALSQIVADPRIEFTYNILHLRKKSHGRITFDWVAKMENDQGDLLIKFRVPLLDKIIKNVELTGVNLVFMQKIELSGARL